jgi:hypothetical protein
VRYTGGDARGFVDAPSRDVDQEAEDELVRKSDKLLKGITATISNPTFWIFARLILILADILTWLSSWVGGCPCHEGHYRADTFYARRMSGSAHTPEEETLSVCFAHLFKHCVVF